MDFWRSINPAVCWSRKLQLWPTFWNKLRPGSASTRTMSRWSLSEIVSGTDRGNRRVAERRSFNDDRLTAIVGIDVESEDGVHLNRLVANHHRAELPAGQGGHHFRGHVRGACLEDAKILQIAGNIENAGDHQARVRQSSRQIGANGLGICDRSRGTVSLRRFRIAQDGGFKIDVVASRCW